MLTSLTFAMLHKVILVVAIFCLAIAFLVKSKSSVFPAQGQDFRKTPLKAAIVIWVMVMATGLTLYIILK
jgi:uncharacterized membrane protein YozB (DUF420 family)